MSFSNFDSLLEVAFALNVSYHFIPSLYDIGKKKIDEIELAKITEWRAKIEESADGTEGRKENYKSYIETIKSSSDETTRWKKVSRFLSSYVATTFAILTIVVLFLSATKWNGLETLSLSWQITVIVALLLPNIVSIFCQIMHWHKIKEQLKNLVNRLEKK